MTSEHCFSKQEELDPLLTFPICKKMDIYCPLFWDKINEKLITLSDYNSIHQLLYTSQYHINLLP